MKKGFTLIELLVSVAVLGGLSTIVLFSFSGAQAGARDARRKSDLKQYQAGLENFANRTNSFYPARTGNTNPNTICATLSLVGCASDPQAPTTNYNYRTNGTNNTNNATQYVLWATLEKRVGGQTWLWVVCSNGTSGRAPTNTNFTGGSCPGGLLE